MDKNGRLVTKHVRNNSADSGRSSFPPPFHVPASLVDETVEAQKDKLSTFCAVSGLGFLATRKILRSLDPKALAILAKHGIGTQGRTLPRNLMEHCKQTKSCDIINDFAAYVDDHGTFSGGSIYEEYSPATYLLGVNEGRADKDYVHYSKANEEERERQHALIEATRTLDVHYIVESSGWGNRDYGFPQRRIREQRIIDYIRRNPERSQELVAFINERGSDILDQGDAVMDGVLSEIREAATPLSGGAL